MSGFKNEHGPRGRRPLPPTSSLTYSSLLIATATVDHRLLIPILAETMFQVHRSSFHSVYTSAIETPIDGWQGQSGSFPTEREGAESRNIGKNNLAILASS